MIPSYPQQGLGVSADGRLLEIRPWLVGRFHGALDEAVHIPGPDPA
jgi:hypothetical protein